MAASSYLVGNVSKSAAYTINPLADSIVTVTATATMTLPASTVCYPGQSFTIVNNIPGATGGVAGVPAGGWG